MREDTDQVLVDVWAKKAPGLRRTLSHLFDPDTAEDVVAQAVVELADELERGNVRYPAALLETIALRRAVDTVREAVREEEKATEARILARPYLDSETAFISTTIDQGIRGLDEADRDAFILTDVRGLSIREASDVLGVSHMTVSRHARAARSHLRKELS